jgi:hypothetical protein
MKLYTKRLHSLEELQREKHVLKYALKHSESDNFLRMGGGKGEKKKNKKEAEEETTDWMAIAGDFLTSKNAGDVALTMGLPLLKMFGLKAGKGIFKNVAKEVFSAYIKWKLVEISYKTALRFIRSKQHQHKPKKSQ